MDMAELNCPICLELAENAVETKCCHQVLCQPCTAELEECPMCRQEKLRVLPSHVVRRLIGKVNVPCPLCKVMVQNANLKAHERVCPSRKFSCAAPDCEFEGPKEDYLNHLTESHSAALLKHAGNIFAPEEVPSTSEGNIAGDLISSTRNSNGKKARLGETGKFYCQSRLHCSCCDGRCGPSHGCNCFHCMKLDIKKRKLPKGFLVNRDGFAARKGDREQKFYCGRRVMVHHSGSDGYCGPSDGPNCQACKRLDRDTERGHRYASLL